MNKRFDKRNAHSNAVLALIGVLFIWISYGSLGCSSDHQDEINNSSNTYGDVSNESNDAYREPEVGTMDSGVACSNGLYLSDSGSCERCPNLSWTCTTANEALSTGPEPDNVQFDTGEPGYTGLRLRGSSVRAQGGGMAATPFNITGVSADGEIFTFDVSELEDSSQTTFISIEIDTVCELNSRVQINRIWNSNTNSLGSSLCR